MSLWIFVASLRRDYGPGIAAALCFLTCATPGMARGQPLWYEQNPPLLRANDLDGLSFDHLGYAGDVESLEFDRGPISETWTRVGTYSIGGRLVSIFNPTWSADELCESYSKSQRINGVTYFGQLRTPAETTHDIYLRTAPLNLASIGGGANRRDSPVRQSRSQPRGADFGNDGGFNLRDVIRRFYEHFADAYDSIAVVPAEATLMQAAACHQTVRNPIAGLGSVVFDDSAQYGSRGRLRAVEMYKSIGSLYLRIHEMAHQWVDFCDSRR